ncbi:hypothetical protein NBM05_14230 [Rothia sp. AR01]|uniref:Uncharacterized protein n=1 Tax=Rothia santali TaxID=2949643 RepID=A0A9X2KMF3_9MICC|nr:hypothetical protein [Rothia santali]MCP3427136.1 hypothetical protein [Rothia santali]
MTHTVLSAATVIAEEGHHVVNELPVQPIWFAIAFMATFIILAFVASSFGGRGVSRSDAAPSDLSSEEQAALSEYSKTRQG